MPTPILALIGPSAVALVLGIVIAWDRLREPHRDPTRPFAVVDARTCRDARRRFDRLVDLGDPVRAWAVADAACRWLTYELRTRRKRGLVKLAADLEQWELRRETMHEQVHH